MNFDEQVKEAFSETKQKDFGGNHTSIWRFLQGKDMGVRKLINTLKIAGKTLKVVDIEYD